MGLGEGDLDGLLVCLCRDSISKRMVPEFPQATNKLILFTDYWIQVIRVKHGNAELL